MISAPITERAGSTISNNVPISASLPPFHGQKPFWPQI